MQPQAYRGNVFLTNSEKSLSSPSKRVTNCRMVASVQPPRTSNWFSREIVVFSLFCSRTQRLSAAVVADVAALIDVYKIYPQDKDRAQLKRIAQRVGLVVDFLPVGQDRFFVRHPVAPGCGERPHFRRVD